MISIIPHTRLKGGAVHRIDYPISRLERNTGKRMFPCIVGQNVDRIRETEAAAANGYRISKESYVF